MANGGADPSATEGQVPVGTGHSGKPSSRRWLRIVFAVSLGIILAAGVLLWTTKGTDKAVTVPPTPLPSLGPAPGFELTNQDGQRVSLSDFKGRVVLMTFFYSTCPINFCPLLNANLRQARDLLDKPSREKVVLLSITFDPEIDTPEVLRKYAKERGFN